MKKIVFLLTGSLSLFTIQSVVFADAHQDIFLSRTPSLTQQSLDSNIRIQSMGGLNLPIEDESNSIGIFKYIGSPAGLATDYKSGKAELSYTYEGGTFKDKGTIGTPFEGTVSDAKQNILGEMAVGHHEFGEGNDASFALHGAQDLDKETFKRSYLDSIGDDSLTDKPKLSNFFAGYGHHYQNWIMGVSYLSSDIKSRDITETAGGTTNKDSQKEKVTEVTPAIGYMFPLTSETSLAVALGPKFRKDEFKSEDTTGPTTTDADLNGTSINGGFVLSYVDQLKFAFGIENGKTNGDDKITSGSNTTLKEKINEYLYKSRVFWHPKDVPVTFGVEYLNGSLRVKTDLSGTQTSDNELTTSNLG